MALLWPMLAAMLIGFALSQQPVINGVTASILGSTLAAAAFSLTLSAMIVLFAIVAIGAPTRASDVVSLPWWAILGGAAGAFFVAGGAYLVPVTGAAVFFTCLIAGQLSGAVIADWLGAWGSEARTLSLPKIAGVCLAFAGVILVRFG